jgi:ATP-binding cassette subfamily C (CFTR/MRP) protein 4
MLFFDTNPIGRILNRFSKDVGFIDDILIFTLCEFFQFVFRFFGIMVTAVIANPYVVIVVIILCVVFVFFRWYFVKPARDIKRIEALSRSPLYSHISMTLQGLSTIRAYGKEDMVINQFHDYHNKQTQAWYLYIISSRWFGLRVDTINCIFIACIAFTAIPLADSVNSSLIGLSLTYALTLNVMFQYCIRQSTEVESLMVSAERVVNYGRLESEASLETPSSAQKPPHWPSSGHIELNNLSYRYSDEKPMVLKDISCTINPGERVGIVGRTGAGKSSLIAAFFRLAEPSGSITIDGIDCFRLGLHDLRSNISIIPQDPVLFTGTIRYNLDPFGSYNDADIWGVIGQVQLKYAVDNLDGGLDSFVSEGGDNFSVGQRQLFCLARALLKNNKILMLDEATANVDLETDAIIQRVIRSQFSHCTVLTIAHRLDTVMDSDKIMVTSCVMQL